jgi:DNA-binding response OmpR family regulator
MDDKTQILIVQGDEALAETLGLLLERAGYHIYQTGRASEGLALARQMRPDLLLVDGAFGSLLATLCDDASLHRIPVLLLTGMGEAPPPSCPPLHAVLEKPCKPQQILAEVEELLALRPPVDAAPLASILVVDDDPDYNQIVARVLRAHGYRVRTATNGSEAWRQMQEATPDLVLLDVMMSTILDGLGVSRRMRDDPALRHVPVLMVSSIADTEYAAAFPTDQPLHMAAWLSKPVDPETLVATVKQYLSSSEPPQGLPGG